MDLVSSHSAGSFPPAPLVNVKPPASPAVATYRTTPFTTQRKIFALGTNGKLASSMQSIGIRTVGVESLDAMLKQMNHTTLGCVVVDSDSIGDEPSALISRLWRHMLGFPVVFVVRPTTTLPTRTLFQAGATDVVHDSLESCHLEDAIHLACCQDDFGSPSARWLRMHLATLTDREREVLRLCLKGSPAKVIASQLGVTFQTIDKHRARGLKKLGVGSLLELVQVMNRVSPNALLKFI